MNTVHELYNAILNALAATREDVVTWGLDPIGITRVEWALNLIEKGAVSDFTNFSEHMALEEVVRAQMDARLQNLLALKSTALDVMQKARECEWLGGWCAQIADDPAQGIAAVLSSSKGHAKQLVN
jgi:hypothetical protein